MHRVATSQSDDGAAAPTATTHATTIAADRDRTWYDDPAVWRLLDLMASPTTPAFSHNILRQVLVVTGADEVALYAGHHQPTLIAAHGRRVFAERRELVDPRVERAVDEGRVIALGAPGTDAVWLVDPHTAVHHALWVPAPAESPTAVVLRVLRIAPKPFPEHTAALLEVVARRLATGLRRLGREQIAQAKAAERAQLFLVSASVAQELDFTKVAQRVVEGLTKVTDYAASTVEVVDGATVRRAATIGDESVDATVRSRLALWREALTDDRVVGELSYRVRLHRSLPADGGESSTAARPGVVTELRDHEGRTVGFLTLSHPRTGDGPTPATVQTIELFARQAQIALSNAALYVDARRQRDLATTLTQVTAAISNSLDTDEILAACCAAAQAHSVAERAVVFLIDEHDIVRLATAHRRTGTGPGWAPRALRDCPLLSAAAAATGPLVVDDPARSARYAAAPTTQLLGARSVALFPLRAAGATIGLLVVDRRAGDVRFAEDDVALLTQIAAQAAVALQQSVLHARTREQAERNAQLLELTTAMTTTLELEAIFGRIVAAVTARVNAHAVSALRIGDGSLHVLGAMSDGHVWCPRPPLQLPIDAQLRRTLSQIWERGTLRIDDVRDVPALSAISRATSRAVLLAAPTDRSDTNVLLTVSSRERAAFTPADERFLGDLAQVTRLAVRNADLYDDVAESARRDPLTGLHNRRVFWDRLQHRLDVLGPRATVALAVVDADDFKQVNDRHGHAVGDAALLHIAGCLSAGVRRSDEIYRIGGEEFTVVMPDATARDAYRVMRRAMRIVRNQGTGLPALSVSVGVAVAPRAGRTADALFGEADRALLDAKRHGKNRIELRRDPA